MEPNNPLQKQTEQESDLKKVIQPEILGDILKEEWSNGD